MNYGHPTRPEGLEENAEHIGSIYWVPGTGDMVVGWDPHFLDDIHEQGFTNRLVDWAAKLAATIAKEFGGRDQ